MNKLTPQMVPLKGHNSFRRVLGEGFKIHTDNFFGAFIPNCIGSDVAKFGISIPKKHAKKAVVRNRTKRLVKECLISLANKENILNFYEFVIIRTTKLPSHPALVRYEQIESEINELFLKARMRVGKNNETHTDRTD